MKRRVSVRAVVGIVCVALVIAGASWITACVDEQMQKQECALLLEQIRNAAIGCYASEGRYPQSIEYLVEHYGLIYDEDRYSVLYDAFASNIMPDIDVRIRGVDER